VKSGCAGEGVHVGAVGGEPMSDTVDSRTRDLDVPSDLSDLETLGYKQELKRGLGNGR
jgi:hypothetical protein